jgi:hypothetical protein
MSGISDPRKTPFPWAGGKSDAAPAVWQALGDVDHYVEPFAGSLAVLLRRPHPVNRTYHSETVNDLDGLLVNAWRSIQLSPDATAEAASWPVSEADLHARHCALVRWRTERQLEHLMGDPEFHDPRMAGWWIWGQSSWIGSGWCAGVGAWHPDETGRLVKQERAPREPGVVRQLPHLGDNGQGCNHAGLREPGVDRQLPHLGDNGKGCNAPQLREPGVDRQRPHLHNGQGCNHAGLREPGCGLYPDDWHPMTMPALRSWLGYLSARLRHVRILNGDWRRACTGGAVLSLSVRMGGGVAGVFLDPPYSTEAERNMGAYACDSGTVAHDVRAWCLSVGDDPRYRVVLAGFDVEHVELEAHGWTVVEWFRPGFLKGGMANTGEGGSSRSQQHRERLWLSPHCLRPAPVDDRQMGLFS